MEQERDRCPRVSTAMLRPSSGSDEGRGVGEKAQLECWEPEASQCFHVYLAFQPNKRRPRGSYSAHIRAHLATSLVGTIPFTFPDCLRGPRLTPLIGREISTLYPQLSPKDDCRGNSGLMTRIETNYQVIHQPVLPTSPCSLTAFLCSGPGSPFSSHRHLAVTVPLMSFKLAVYETEWRPCDKNHFHDTWKARSSGMLTSAVCSASFAVIFFCMVMWVRRTRDTAASYCL